MPEDHRSSVDLPEPQRRILSAEELAERRWNLFQSLNIFLFAYAFLHKVIVPVVRAGLLERVDLQFSSIDWWWPYHLLLYIAFSKHAKKWICGLANFGLSFTLLKLVFGLYYASKGGENLSWKVVSLMMTEGFTLGYLIALFLQPALVRGSIRMLPRIIAIFVGAGLSALFYAASPMYPSFTLITPPEKIAEYRESKAIKNVESEGNCGLNNVTLKESTVDGIPRRSEISVDPCGFQPGILRVSDRLRIQNNTDQFLNIKIEYLEKKGETTKWHLLKNLPLLANSHLDLEPSWYKHQVVRIFSDTNLRAGISVVLGGKKEGLAYPITVER